MRGEGGRDRASNEGERAIEHELKYIAVHRHPIPSSCASSHVEGHLSCGCGDGCTRGGKGQDGGCAGEGSDRIREGG